MKSEFDNIYNIEVQKLLLSHLIDDPDVFVRCRSIIKDDYFDDKLRRAVRFILSHADEFQEIPNSHLIHAKTNVMINSLSDYGISMNSEWFLTEIVQFCRYKGIENLLLEGVDLLQKNQFSTIETRLKDALTISLVSDLGISYFDDPRSRLEKMLDKSAMVSTGWESFDKKLFGGFIRGGLNVFAGGPGSGKSLVLQNLALNWALMGHTVVYFTLELSEELVSLRIDSMITGKSTKEVFGSVGDTAFSIKMKGKKAGTLFIKKMPEGGTNTNDMRAYIKELQIKTGLKPDCIVIDYLDLMYPNNQRIDVSNLFVKDKYVSEEIRALMYETDSFGATASQLNRSSVEANGEFDHSHIAGGISKINTSDNVIAINAPSHMKEKGELEFMFLKTRSSSAVGQKIRMRYGNTSMRIDDIFSSDTIETEKPSSTAELKERISQQVDKVTEGRITQFDGLMVQQRRLM